MENGKYSLVKAVHKVVNLFVTVVGSVEEADPLVKDLSADSLTASRVVGILFESATRGVIFNHATPSIVVLTEAEILVDVIVCIGCVVNERIYLVHE